ncbi:LytTR family DNA-binding domain-containing protein [Sediminicola luteus]|uniref:HTH LytTR-type domain-containing protein n=1 Tax=Sediminicola luteus TaxID=319238 RepID=A0A2A4G8D9_9FLAO|nr:LytTR family DNA-binding domain-containing protein [Sediminicola luteus]PCE64240.1 hypothetical protein B7P33_08025 [Sediminicola luteus]
MKFWNFLNSPNIYFKTGPDRWRYMLSSILFASIFIIVFLPQFADDEEKVMAKIHIILPKGIMAISLSILLGQLFSQFLLPKLFKFRPKQLKGLLWVFLIEVILITTLFDYSENIFFYHVDHDDCYIYNSVIIDTLFLYTSFVILISYPFIGNLLYQHIHNLRTTIDGLEGELQHIKSHYAKLANQNPGRIEFKDENGQLQFSCEWAKLLYLKSDNQYVEVFSECDGKLVKQVVRNRLKNILDLAPEGPLVRSHRSYAVNMMRINQLKNQNQKQFLQLDSNTEVLVPISKTYLNELRQVGLSK